MELRTIRAGEWGARAARNRSLPAQLAARMAGSMLFEADSF